MLACLPAALRGSLGFLLFVLNTIFWCTPCYMVILMRLLIPQQRLQQKFAALMVSIAECWISCNNQIMRLTQRIEWDVQGVEELQRDAWYLITSNHQSWVDIIVLQKVFNRRIPFMKFFIKQQLIWVPILGGVWWGLDFPFMQRHSAAHLARHPEARDEDWETTRRACARYCAAPSSLLNFLEGTRFLPEKHAKQRSPYRHLLRPKAAGIAYALEGMAERLHALLDVTIVYPDGYTTFLDLLMGRVRRVVVRVKTLEIPSALIGGDYRGDAEYRTAIKQWLGALWADKDLRIEKLLAQYQAPV